MQSTELAVKFLFAPLASLPNAVYLNRSVSSILINQ